MSDIKAVIFDWGRVLYDFDNNVFLNRIAEHSDKTPDELEGLIYKISNLPRYYETGNISTKEFSQGVIELCGLDMTQEQFADAYTQDKCWPIPEMHELMRKLKDADYKLGLLTNTSELDYDRTISKMDRFDLFDARTASHLVGVMKPDERIYEDSVAQLVLEENQCVYIDDIKRYVSKFRDMGGHGIHHVSPESTINSLRSFGIRIAA